jgi:hypothetical protein
MIQRCRIRLAIQRLGISTQESRGNVRIPGNDGHGQIPDPPRPHIATFDDPTFIKIDYLGYSGDV